MTLSDISIRWRILFFFCLLGIVPQVVISTISVHFYTRSLEETYTHQVSQLVTQTAEQTSTKSSDLIKELTKQTAQPYLQLSFQQFPLSTRLQLLRERLERFRVSSGVYSRLDLCYRNGEPLVSAKLPGKAADYVSFERDAIRKSEVGLDQVFQQIYTPEGELALFIPVYSFRQPTKVVGFMVAYIPLRRLTTYLEKLELGFAADKYILTAAGELVQSFTKSHHPQSTSLMREYSAVVDSLQWQIVVSIAEEELFGDVFWLKQKSMLFIAAIIVLTFGFTFVFTHRFTRPFKKIIAGTRVFAKGNLEHRISIRSGHEARQLATAFNEMASQLNDRQQELNQAVRLASLGVMTAGIGHEIKNPLTGIKTSSQVINKILSPQEPFADSNNDIALQSEDVQEVAELARGISSEADRLTTILNDLLEFGRPRQSKSIHFDIQDTVNHAVSLVGPEFEKKQVCIDIRGDSCQILADPDQILQVLLNLLLNALASVNREGGMVQIISYLSPGGVVHLKIVDNGEGIASDKIHRIFDPFFTLQKGGTGLGLSVVYTLLKQNRASIKVTSVVNQGTTFTITFSGNNLGEEE